MKTDFVTVINCMDGRVQLPVIHWLQEQYNHAYVDSITEPGPVKILAEQNDTLLLQSIKKRLDISIHKHGSQVITLVAHDDCTGNPLGKEQQLNQLKKAAGLLHQWYPSLHLITLWVDINWSVSQINTED